MGAEPADVVLSIGTSGVVCAVATVPATDPTGTVGEEAAQRCFDAGLVADGVVPSPAGPHVGYASLAARGGAPGPPGVIVAVAAGALGLTRV